MVALAIAVSAEAARAEPCGDAGLTAPADVAVHDTAIDSPRGACVDGGWYWTNRALALIDTADFYGTLTGAALLGVRVDPKVVGADIYFPVGSVELGARVADFRFAQTAVFAESELSIGPVFVGVSTRPWRWGDTVADLALRVDLPLTNRGYGVPTWGLAGMARLSWRASPSVTVHGRAGAVQLVVDPIDDAYARHAGLVSGDVGWAATSWLGLAVGAEAQAGWFDLGLDHLLVRAAARVRVRGHHRIELGGAAVLAGNDRTDLAVALSWVREVR